MKNVWVLKVESNLGRVNEGRRKNQSYKVFEKIEDAADAMRKTLSEYYNEDNYFFGVEGKKRLYQNISEVIIDELEEYADDEDEGFDMNEATVSWITLLDKFFSGEKITKEDRDSIYLAGEQWDDDKILEFNPFDYWGDGLYSLYSKKYIQNGSDKTLGSYVSPVDPSGEYEDFDDPAECCEINSFEITGELDRYCCRLVSDESFDPSFLFVELIKTTLE